MAAWFPVSQWTPSMISTYRQAVVSATPMLVRRRARFTCEDFALGLVIDFAANNRLPLLLANETYPNGMRPEQWSTLDAYRNDVLSTTGARDLLRAENTVPVSSLPNGMLEHLRSRNPAISFSSRVEARRIFRSSRVARRERRRLSKGIRPAITVGILRLCGTGSPIRRALATTGSKSGNTNTITGAITHEQGGQPFVYKVDEFADGISPAGTRFPPSRLLLGLTVYLRADRFSNRLLISSRRNSNRQSQHVAKWSGVAETARHYQRGWIERHYLSKLGWRWAAGRPT